MKKLNSSAIVSLSLAMSLVFSFVGPSLAFASNASSVNLGQAGNYTILAKTGISTTGTTSIIGNVGVSPAAATFITGFGLILPASGTFSNSSLVTGKIYAPGYANPTPSNLTTAVLDMQNAFTDALSRAPGVTELGSGNIGGLTLAPDVYKWGTGVTIPTDVTLSGSANDIWIFQIAQNLNVSSATKIVLAGGAKAENIYWVVSGQTTIGTTAVFNGNILDQTAIVLNTGATLNGKALAQTAVTLDSNAVSSTSTSSINDTPTVVQDNSSTSHSGGYVSSGYNPNNNNLTNNDPKTIFVNNSALPQDLSLGCSGDNKFNARTGNPCVNNVGNKNQTSSVSNNSYKLGNSILVLGNNSEEVKELQRFLNNSYDFKLTTDGVFGKKTVSVLKQWQTSHGLKADGKVGNLTKIKIYENKKL